MCQVFGISSRLSLKRLGGGQNFILNSSLSSLSLSASLYRAVQNTWACSIQQAPLTSIYVIRIYCVWYSYYRVNCCGSEQFLIIEQNCFKINSAHYFRLEYYVFLFYSVIIPNVGMSLWRYTEKIPCCRNPSNICISSLTGTICQRFSGERRRMCSLIGTFSSRACVLTQCAQESSMSASEGNYVPRECVL